MAYSGVIHADAPVAWFRLTEQGGGYSKNVGSDPSHAYCLGSIPTIGFTGIASDGGAVALNNAGSLECQPQAIITATSGFSLEAWIFYIGQSPFNTATTDWPVSLFIDSSTGFQLGVVPSSRLATMRDPSSTSHGASASAAGAAGWHHLVATRQSGATPPAHLYVDGSLVGSTAAYAGFGTNQPTRVNLNATPTPTSLLIAEPAVYFYELSAGQVAAHFAAADTMAAPRYINRLNGVCQ